MIQCRSLLALAVLMTACAVAAEPDAAAFDGQRLFTTPAERQRLDELRAQRELQSESTEAASSETKSRRNVPADRPPPAVRLRGFVRRSGGPDAVWVNEGNTLSGGSVTGGIEVLSGRLEGATVVVKLPDGRTIRLKPGQTWDPATGQVVDSYRQ